MKHCCPTISKDQQIAIAADLSNELGETVTPKAISERLVRLKRQNNTGSASGTGTASLTGTPKKKAATGTKGASKKTSTPRSSKKTVAAPVQDDSENIVDDEEDFKGLFKSEVGVKRQLEDPFEDMTDTTATKRVKAEFVDPVDSDNDVI